MSIKTTNTNTTKTNNKRQHNDDESSSYEIVPCLKSSRTEKYTANLKRVKWSRNPSPNEHMPNQTSFKQEARLEHIARILELLSGPIAR